jgi:LPXTG-site transpeptidase (sortase) family protein
MSIQDWQSIRADLRRGISVSYGTSTYDTAARVFITGHSSDTYPHRYASVFAGLNGAKVGDRCALTRQGHTYQYEVTDKRVVDPSDAAFFTPASLVKNPGEPQEVFLVTCWPVFTTKNRLVVVGHQI